mmetsp:Transcript_5021/g.13721  ORF Transcript_5021/g.13721 Transcript_5021/m.13721 type:complete len:120 (+) Transcript_5021:211-570(+)
MPLTTPVRSTPWNSGVTERTEDRACGEGEGVASPAEACSAAIAAAGEPAAAPRNDGVEAVLREAGGGCGKLLGRIVAVSPWSAVAEPSRLREPAAFVGLPVREAAAAPLWPIGPACSRA